MNSKTKQKPSWLQEMTEVETKQTQADFVEPFEKTKPSIELGLAEFNGFFACISRPATRKRVDYLLRVDDDLNDDLVKQCQGSKNSVINALLRYALNDLKEKKKTLIG